VKALMICTEKLPVPPVRGGAIQTYVAAVAPLLAKAGIDLTVLGVTDPELPAEERREGVRYVRVEGGSLDRYRESVIAFLQQERSGAFDRIHIFNRPRLVGPIAQAAPGTPLSLSLHNEMFLPRKIDPAEAQAAVRAVDRIATVSNFIAKGIADLYPEAGPKLKTIYSGVDAGQFVPGSSAAGRPIREQVRSAQNLSGKKLVLFVGRLSHKKGADVLLRAMELVAREHPDAALALVGSKWYGADELTDFVAYLRALSNRSPVPVVTTGFVTPEQVNQWFAAGDIFVCPSVWQEPLARVHYEAMASGLPIITTRRGGNPEVVDGTGVGLVVDEPESPEAMARAIIALLRSASTREAMGQAGRKLALERFTWDRVAKEIQALWTEGAAEQVATRREGEVDRAGAQAVAPVEESAPPEKQVRQTKKKQQGARAKDEAATKSKADDNAAREATTRPGEVTQAAGKAARDDAHRERRKEPRNEGEPSVRAPGKSRDDPNGVQVEVVVSSIKARPVEAKGKGEGSKSARGRQGSSGEHRRGRSDEYRTRP
jgi:spore coat protein SA